MAERNEHGCNTRSLSDSLASGTRSTAMEKTLKTRGKMPPRVQAGTVLSWRAYWLSRLKAADRSGLRIIMPYFWSIMAYLRSIIGINCEHQSIAQFSDSGA